MFCLYLLLFCSTSLRWFEHSWLQVNIVCSVYKLYMLLLWISISTLSILIKNYSCNSLIVNHTTRRGGAALQHTYYLKHISNLLIYYILYVRVSKQFPDNNKSHWIIGFLSKNVYILCSSLKDNNALDSLKLAFV